ncbi:ABC transporter permease [Solirubrobacter ginsenosidimutans]|uniref:ABC transporter permease n=1 Tax=Solirubrobacter ginsenosidimutans TaxID=490573 RepID=A0A9X3N2V5_9ACTN|nr:ABC transporter permease [Solirubrobacter ginsenosidimutans]MDA0166241.1 ABC transporter permease [Solirubrobacter ginsenosidimutans]
MAAYIARRLIWVVFLLFVITLITFVIFSVLPSGDPAVARAGRQPTPELVATIRAQLGLDKSKPVQFINYIGDLLPFVGHNGVYFGFSYQNNADVLPEILKRLPTTLFLTAGAVLLWLSIGIPIGVLSAVKTGSWMDRLAMGIALIFISAPVYFLGLVALYLFADDIGKFPILPGNSAYNSATTFPEKAEALIMPWCVLAAAFAAVYARFLRGNLIDTLQEDYIRTARAKGLSERRVVFRHGVRAAITPIVTLLGLDIGILLGGAILTETVFNIPGIGRYAFNAINNSDLPVIQGTVLVGAFFIVMMSLLVDILYAFIDPRVRY